MSTQHCGLTAPVASTTVYLFGDVHSTATNNNNSLWDYAGAISPYCFIMCKHSQLTFKLERELIGVVESEHLLVRCLIICIEDELSGEHEHRKASFHQLRLSMLLLHWLQLSSSSVHSLPQTPTLFINKPFSCVGSLLMQIMLQRSSPQGHDILLRK